MGYYIRAFCASSKVPTPAAIQKFLKAEKSKAILDNPDHAMAEVAAGKLTKPTIDLKNAKWEQIAICYRAGKLPILADCNRADQKDSLMREEIEEFVELIGKPGRSPGKARVLEHLARTKFIIACQVPLSEVEKDGYQAVFEFLWFFRETCGAMIQADGRGFIDEKNKILVKLD
jgi:hypothetical protein